jgi:hypothetical protein
MNDCTTKTPVALIIFNRPGLTKTVFEQIRKARPPKLFVIADGPRPGNTDDVMKCRAAREVIETIDWPCEVFRNYSDENLGCGVRPSTGISWLFEHEEEAIILEDDCVPHPCFFRFCTELLERYRDDERIMHISGNNCAIECKGAGSYYFSRIPHCWGWATWRRAWRHFDYEMKDLPEVLSRNELAHIWPDNKARRLWEGIFTRMFPVGQKHIWDYQWTFACLANGGLSITPNETLVSNIGFNADATHTKKANHPFAALLLGKIVFPLHHPSEIVYNEDADNRMIKEVFGVNRINDTMRILRSIFKRRL